MAVDESLQEYASLKGSWDSLLLGNGSSIAVSQSFEYGRLYDEAALSAADRRLFESLDTTNFEAVLDSLRVARLVCAQHRHRHQEIRARYEGIREALFDAVIEVHAAWTELSLVTLRTIRHSLRAFDTVYSTNYDLLVYWSFMRFRDGAGFVDYFWGPGHSFDISDTDVYPDKTKVLYLHGALHLYRHIDGSARKRTAASGNLLRSAATDTASVPLFVSEGRSREKLAAIRRSDYLTFAYEEYVNDDRPIVVFGHSLSGPDVHIRRALNRRGRRVAIGIRPGKKQTVIAAKARLLELLPAATLSFYDATTHPLGQVSQIP